MSLLIALIVKKSHILAENYLIIRKNFRRRNLKGFQNQTWSEGKEWKSSYQVRSFLALFLQSYSNLRLKLRQKP